MTNPHSCSTFLLSRSNLLLVGHNLDDYIPVPGVVWINPRGIAKQNISWDDLRLGRQKSHPRLNWVSRFGSITCNAFGKEFPDGGLNEAGLYVGEMTLLGSVYPKDKSRPAIHHHQWIQYLLDNFETVEQVLNDLGRILITGHCQWHFFIADRSGQAAVIEFLGGKSRVYTGTSLPVKALCNASYSDELVQLVEYQGFGGSRPVDFENRSGPTRFVQAATILQNDLPETTAVDFAFQILQQLDCGNNQWKLVFDILERRLYFQTYRAPRTRTASLASFDFSNSQPARMFDIHEDTEGDVSARFTPYQELSNRHAIQETWSGINMGVLLNTFFKPILVRRLNGYPKSFEAR